MFVVLEFMVGVSWGLGFSLGFKISLGLGFKVECRVQGFRF